MRIVIYGNKYQDRHISDLQRLFDALSRHKAFIEVEKSFYDYLCQVMENPPHVDAVISDNDDLSANIALSIGGDGTFLRTAQRVAIKGIPVLGIKTGTLGYLADVHTDHIEDMVEELFNGDYKVENRSLIEVFTSEDVDIKHPYALNEVAILKEDTASMLKVDTTVNGTYLTTYLGDGLIVSTPTGSTAYNLSVGGPILEPTLQCFVLSPIAPHSLTMRPLILNDECYIKTTAFSRSNSYRLSIDGKSYVMKAGSTVTLHKAPYKVRVIQRLDHNFAETLRNKLMWGIDKR